NPSFLFSINGHNFNGSTKALLSCQAHQQTILCLPLRKRGEAVSTANVNPRPVLRLPTTSTDAPILSSAGGTSSGSMKAAGIIAGVVVAVATPVIRAQARKLAQARADRRRKSRASSHNVDVVTDLGADD